MAPVKEAAGSSFSEERLMAALSYLWLLSVVILILKKDNPFITFHAKQGLVLFIASIILWLIPLFGWLLEILVIFGILVGLLKALAGEEYRLPLVADLAEKIKI